ncbi:hypothetical protein HYQ46_000085 [Verticillium longisporum]|nr:hypothetical protein HYQ46_000085 [Verticillium longisporum]
MPTENSGRSEAGLRGAQTDDRSDESEGEAFNSQDWPMLQERRHKLFSIFEVPWPGSVGGIVGAVARRCRDVTRCRQI